MKKERGFTLIELMVTLAIAAILIGVALPSFRGMMETNKVVAGINDLATSIHLAKNAASARNARVNIDSVGGAADWSQGLIIYADTNGSGVYEPANDALVRSIPPIASTTNAQVIPTVPTPTISFSRKGIFLAGAAGAQFVVNYCAPSIHFVHERILTVSVAGRVTVTRPVAELC